MGWILMHLLWTYVAITGRNQTLFHYMYMWQSRVEIEHYFIAYFDRITMFSVLQLRTLVKGEVHMWCVDMSAIHESMEHIWVLPLTKVNSVLQHTKRSDVIETQPHSHAPMLRNTNIEVVQA